MEIRCSSCGHVGVARVDVGADGVGLICANCDYRNVLDLGGEPVPAPRVTPPTSYPPRAIARKEEAKRVSEKAFEEEAFARLLPTPGSGPRCLKCMEILDAEFDHCVRCGLNVEESRRFEPGEAPWEKAPLGREESWDEADLMWRRLEEDWGEERFQDFAECIRQLEAQDFAARKLKKRLVDYPDDELARNFLREIAAGLQSRVMVAKAQAEASAAQFSDATERARRVLLWVVGGMWAVIIILIVVYYLK